MAAIVNDDVIYGDARCSRIHTFKLQILDSRQLYAADGNLKLLYRMSQEPVSHQQAIGAHSVSILNLPERDCPGIRRASCIRSAKISFAWNQILSLSTFHFGHSVRTQYRLNKTGFPLARMVTNRSVSFPLFPSFFFNSPFWKYVEGIN